MSTNKDAKKEIKLSQDVVDAVETLTGGFNGFDETGTGSFKEEAVAEVTGRFYTADEEKRVHKGRDVMLAATAQVFANNAGTFLKENESVKQATINVGLNKDSIGHTMNREGAMTSEYLARGATGPELKKVYKLMASKLAEE